MGLGVLRLFALVIALSVFAAAQCTETCSISHDGQENRPKSSSSSCHGKIPGQNSEHHTCIHDLTSAQFRTAAVFALDLTVTVVDPGHPPVVFATFPRSDIEQFPPLISRAFLAITVLRI